MIQVDRNMDGTGRSYYKQFINITTKKRFIALQGTRKPSVDIYMPLKQSTDIFGTAGAPTALISPKWLNTADTEAAGVPTMVQQLIWVELIKVFFLPVLATLNMFV